MGWKVTLAAWIQLSVPGFASKCSGRKRLSHRPPYRRLARTPVAAAPFRSCVANDDAIYSPRIASGWMRGLRERLDLTFEQSLHGRDLQRCFRPEHERRALPTREDTDVLSLWGNVAGWE